MVTARRVASSRRLRRTGLRMIASLSTARSPLNEVGRNNLGWSHPWKGPPGAYHLLPIPARSAIFRVPCRQVVVLPRRAGRAPAAPPGRGPASAPSGPDRSDRVGPGVGYHLSEEPTTGPQWSHHRPRPFARGSTGRRTRNARSGPGPFPLLTPFRSPADESGDSPARCRRPGRAVRLTEDESREKDPEMRYAPVFNPVADAPRQGPGRLSLSGYAAPSWTRHGHGRCRERHWPLMSAAITRTPCFSPDALTDSSLAGTTRLLRARCRSPTTRGWHHRPCSWPPTPPAHEGPAARRCRS